MENHLTMCWKCLWKTANKCGESNQPRPAFPARALDDVGIPTKNRYWLGTHTVAFNLLKKLKDRYSIIIVDYIFKHLQLMHRDVEGKC